MTAALIFLLAVIGIALWWLSHQRLTSKPWLESGLDSVEDGADGIDMPKAKIGLIVFLAVVGTLFALFTSGYFMRQEMSDWRAMPLPPVLWLNTGLLVFGSISLHFALIAARNDDLDAVKNRLGLACIFTIGFLTGQIVAWMQLVANGFVLTENPATSFFYLITGIHGLHIIGGLVALSRTTLSARRHGAVMNLLRPRIELCALYWHFLLFVWIVVLAAMLGWLSDPFFNAAH